MPLIKDPTTIVIDKSTRKLLSHLKYEMKVDTYNDVILDVMEKYKGARAFRHIKRFLGIPIKDEDK